MGIRREHAALAYLSNFIPRMRWGMALLPRQGDSRLLCSMSSRDVPAMRTMTWITDVHSGWEWNKAFDPWIETQKGDGEIALATIGFDLMAPALQAAVTRSLGNSFRLHRVDDILEVPGPRKRPREVALIRSSCRILEAAAMAYADGWRRERKPEAGALAAERIARAMAAQDVRTLVSLDDGRTLMPYQGRFEAAGNRLVGYLAVKYAGYWADQFIAAGATPDALAGAVGTAQDALIAAVQPGVTGDALYSKVAGLLAPNTLHPVLSASVGHRIGLSLHEGPEFRAGTDAAIELGGVYCLQVGMRDAAGGLLSSAIVRATRQGAEVFSRTGEFGMG